MGEEKNSHYYDGVYTDNQKYDCHYEKSPYYPIWENIAKVFLNPSDKIIELGCGTGQYAKMLIDYKFKYLLGVDFSQTAIEKAKKVTGKNFFICESLFEKELWGLIQTLDYNTVVILEVLEHIKNDVQIIENIPPGKKIIFSVPNFDCHGHVRHFENKEKVKERYENLIRFSNIKILDFRNGNKIFYTKGRKI